MAFPVVSSDALAGQGIQFVQNSANDYDHGVITTLPNLFGDGEFTLKVVIDPYQVSTIGQTVSAPGIRENWANENATIYTTDWWFYGNFLLDGHNNTNFYAGTFSLQVFNSGYVRWTFGDGSSADARTGDLHGIQSPSGINVLDGERHVIHCVRRWDGGTGSELELYVDGVSQDMETSTTRTNMASTYWDSWTGFPASQDGWFWGAEKQAANASIGDWADYKGIIREVAFYGDDLSGAEITADQSAVDTGHADYLDHFAFTEGTGTTTDSANAITMTLNNTQASFWP